MSLGLLPVELITRICNHLELQDWLALRLSCHTFYERSLSDFAETYFKRIHFMVISESLHELEELSKAKVFRRHVQELWMIPSVFEGAERCKGNVAISSKSCRQVKGDALETRYAIHKSMFADHSNLLQSETSGFSTRLQRCLDRFRNLETIGLAHYKTTFLLDPRQQKVKFLGWRHILSRIDFRYDIYSLQSLTQTDKDSPIRITNSLALSKFFLALSGSSCKPRKLYTCNSDLCGDIGPTITLTEEQYSSLLSALSELEDVHLCIDLNATAWLRLITHVAPHLIRLTLSQDHLPLYRLQSYNGQFFRGVNLARLQELYLHEMKFMFNGLKSLLISVKNTLAVLTLKKVRILSEDSTSPQQIDYQEAMAPWGQPGDVSPALSPIFTPDSPVFVPTSSSPDYTIPASPSFQPARPASEPDSLQGVSASLQHSSKSESSESTTAEYLSEKYWSTYDPWPPTKMMEGAVDPVDPTPYRPMPIEPNMTCVASFLDLLQKVLSLNILSIDNLVCDGREYFGQSNNKVYFDIHTTSAGTLFGDWISRLKPEGNSPSPPSEVQDKEMEEWFDGMLGENSGSLKRFDCDCKRKPLWGCPFGCDR